MGNYAVDGVDDLDDNDHLDNVGNNDLDNKDNTDEENADVYGGGEAFLSFNTDLYYFRKIQQ